MNVRLVVVWAIVIVLLAGAGLFGYVAKDTRVDEDRYKDIISEEKDYVEHTCTGKTDKANIDYIFQVTKDNNIKKIVISYQTLNSNPILDSAVESFKSYNTQGLSSAYNFDSEHKFKLSVSLTPSMINEDIKTKINDDCTTLGIAIFSETNYNNYVNSLKNFGSYTCN